MASSDTKSVTYKAESKIDVPSPEKERRKAIRIVDWIRLKRKIDSLEIPSNTITRLYSTFFGAFLSFGANYVIVRNAQDISPFTKAVYLCVSVFSLAFSITFYILNKRAAKSMKKDCDEIILDMDEIESTFEEVDTGALSDV